MYSRHWPHPHKYGLYDLVFEEHEVEGPVYTVVDVVHGVVNLAGWADDVTERGHLRRHGERTHHHVPTRLSDHLRYNRVMR